MKKQEEKQLLVFGYGLPLICLVLAWRQHAKHGLTVWVEGLIITGFMVLLMTLLARPWLKVLFKYWMKVAKVIGMVVTTLILTVFFFIVMTPVSIILRLMGKDFMNLRKGLVDSYWIKCENRKRDYTQQF